MVNVTVCDSSRPAHNSGIYYAVEDADGPGEEKYDTQSMCFLESAHIRDSGNTCTSLPAHRLLTEQISLNHKCDPDCISCKKNLTNTQINIQSKKVAVRAPETSLKQCHPRFPTSRPRVASATCLRLIISGCMFAVIVLVGGMATIFKLQASFDARASVSLKRVNVTPRSMVFSSSSTTVEPPGALDQVANRLVSVLDTTMPPCEDFYTFACGRFDYYVSRTSGTLWRTQGVSMFDIIQEAIENHTISMLLMEDTSDREKYRNSSAGKRSDSFSFGWPEFRCTADCAETQKQMTRTLNDTKTSVHVYLHIPHVQTLKILVSQLKRKHFLLSAPRDL